MTHKVSLDTASQTENLPTLNFGCQTEYLPVNTNNQKNSIDTACQTNPNLEQDPPNSSRTHRVVKDPSEFMGQSRNAEVIFICDSTGKHIDQNRFYGIKKVYQVKSPTAEYSRELLSSSKSLDSVETCIIHQGINDLADKCPVETLCNNLKDLLCQANEIYPKADIIYSEIICTNDCPWKNTVVSVNNDMKQFCVDHNFIYCTHRSHRFNSNWFVDHKHINDESGTKVFVSELQRAGRSWQTPDGRKSKRWWEEPQEYESQTRWKPSSEYTVHQKQDFMNNGPANQDRQRQKHEFISDSKSNRDILENREKQETFREGSMDQMIKLLTLKMIQSL
jgi:hypothetical protein